jgi:cell division topological specificity factor
MISTLLDRLFQRSNVPSGAQVKQRLKFILAHDRAAIEPQVFESMRHEIMRVVSKYVELDESSLDIRLESDKRMTALIANLPIRMVREEFSNLEELFDQPNQSDQADVILEADPSSLEMDRFAEEALDAIAAKETKNNPPENITSENIAEIAERTINVSTKLRNAANKTQVLETDQELITNNIQAPVVVSPEQLAESPHDVNQIEQENDQVEDQENDHSDQLELSFNLSESSESQDVVSENHSE